jgi:hypothetical protein
MVVRYTCIKYKKGVFLLEGFWGLEQKGALLGEVTPKS